MKAENMFIGQRVQIKADSTHGFYTHNLGEIGTIVRIGYNSDVYLKLDNGRTDWGHHEGIRKVKD